MGKGGRKREREREMTGPKTSHGSNPENQGKVIHTCQNWSDVYLASSQRLGMVMTMVMRMRI